MHSLTHLVPHRATGAMLSITLALLGCSSDEGNDPGDDDQGIGSIMRELSEPLLESRARGTALGGNATGTHECTEEGRYDHYEEPPAEDATQLHVIGIGEAGEGGLQEAGEPIEEGEIDIQLERAGTSILVLSASGRAHWKVTVGPGATLERVILSGGYAQRATVPDGVPVDVFSGEQTESVLGGIGFEWPSYSTTDLVDAAEELTGATLTSFRGCYRSDSFQIEEPGELEPPHPVSDNPDPAVPPGCEALTAESTYCVSLTADGLAAVGLDSGTVCTSELTPELQLVDASSLGWQGDYLYGCALGVGIARISIIDGTVDIAPIACEMATTYDGGFVARVGIEPEDAPFGLLAQFADFDHIAVRKAEHIFALDPYATRIAVEGDQAYFGWHAASTVETARLADGEPIKSIPLEGFDNWIMGMDITSDGKLAITSWFDTDSLYVFDAETGAATGQVPSELPARLGGGLKCVSGGG
jgi:hypothetical protein